MEKTGFRIYLKLGNTWYNMRRPALEDKLMALTLKQKRKRASTVSRPHPIANMTTDELRALVEAMIDRKLAKFNRTRTPLPSRAITARMRQRAVSAAGRFHSGHADISAHHDDYLAASYRA